MYLIKADNSSRELEKKVIGFLKKKKIKYSYDNGNIALIIGGDDFILKIVQEFSDIVPVLGIHDGSSFFAEANSLNFSNYIELIEKKQYKIR